MGTCFCTGRCMGPGGYCSASGRGAPQVGHAVIRERPLTEADVRRILREELERALKKAEA